jgi:hypothetical protein
LDAIRQTRHGVLPVLLLPSKESRLLDLVQVFLDAIDPAAIAV